MSREARFDRIRITDVTIDFKKVVPPMDIVAKGSYADERGNMFGQVTGVTFSREVMQMIAQLRQQMELELEALAFVGEGINETSRTMGSASSQEAPRGIGDHVNEAEQV